jgi:hypothetical protein
MAVYFSRALWVYVSSSISGITIAISQDYFWDKKIRFIKMSSSNPGTHLIQDLVRDPRVKMLPCSDLGSCAAYLACWICTQH